VIKRKRASWSSGLSSLWDNDTDFHQQEKKENNSLTCILSISPKRLRFKRHILTLWNSRLGSCVKFSRFWTLFVGSKKKWILYASVWSLEAYHTLSFTRMPFKLRFWLGLIYRSSGYTTHTAHAPPLPYLSTIKIRRHLTPLAICIHTSDIGSHWGSPCLGTSTRKLRLHPSTMATCIL